MKPGTRVVIAFNPHDEGASDIVGTVVEFKASGGFMGCDLVTVRYTDPRDGTERELPFAAYNLLPGDRASLLARAERHEEQARWLREMAGD